MTIYVQFFLFVFFIKIDKNNLFLSKLAHQGGFSLQAVIFELDQLI